jgi:uncharacterized coiled-coil DUF342 family protein
MKKKKHGRRELQMAQQQITPEQALNFIDEIAAQASVTRQQHATVQQCIAGLRSLLASVGEQAGQIEKLRRERDEWKEKAEALKEALTSSGTSSGSQNGPINVQAGEPASDSLPA